jgi:hypothetical protein
MEEEVRIGVIVHILHCTTLSVTVPPFSPAVDITYQQ